MPAWPCCPVASPVNVYRPKLHAKLKLLQGGEASEAEEADEVLEQRPHSSAVHLVFLSARPESYRGWTEELSFREIFEPLINNGIMAGPPMLLLGSIRSGPLALWDYSGLPRGIQYAQPTSRLHSGYLAQRCGACRHGR